MNKVSKKIVLGVEDFKEIIDNNIYFADKTMLIENFFDHLSKVVIVTRPHKFGKSVNMSMLRRFLEDERTEQGERIDNRYLFDGLAVSRCDEDILKHQQQYPVISFSFKEARGSSFEETWQKVCEAIAAEFRRHRYVLECEKLLQWQIDEYIDFMNGTAKPSRYTTAPELLSGCLDKYHGSCIYLLADAYDTPLEYAYRYGFYNEMADYICNMYGCVCKSNPHLERAVLTGILDVAEIRPPDIFNNFTTNDIFSHHQDECFGFTQEDTEAALEFYGLSDCIDKVREWYGNYSLGSRNIYNQWSVLSYIKHACESGDKTPQAYWPAPSYVDIVEDILYNKNHIYGSVEDLMNGRTVESWLHYLLTWEDIDGFDTGWHFLAAAGYLVPERLHIEGDDRYMEFAIPNVEVKTIYRQIKLERFISIVDRVDREPIVRALEQGDCDEAGIFISRLLANAIDCVDFTESFYYEFMVKLLSKTDYKVDSENGSNMVFKDDRGNRAIILEFTIADNIRQLEAKCDEALKQIDGEKYADEITESRYDIVQKYGISFCKQECMIKQGEMYRK